MIHFCNCKSNVKDCDDETIKKHKEFIKNTSAVKRGNFVNYSNGYKFPVPSTKTTHFLNKQDNSDKTLQEPPSDASRTSSLKRQNKKSQNSNIKTDSLKHRITKKDIKAIQQLHKYLISTLPKQDVGKSCLYDPTQHAEEKPIKRSRALELRNDWIESSKLNNQSKQILKTPEEVQEKENEIHNNELYTRNNVRENRLRKKHRKSSQVKSSRQITTSSSLETSEERSSSSSENKNYDQKTDTSHSPVDNSNFKSYLQFLSYDEREILEEAENIIARNRLSKQTSFQRKPKTNKDRRTKQHKISSTNNHCTESNSKASQTIPEIKKVLDIIKLPKSTQTSPRYCEYCQLHCKCLSRPTDSLRKKHTLSISVSDRHKRLEADHRARCFASLNIDPSAVEPKSYNNDKLSKLSSQKQVIVKSIENSHLELQTRRIENISNKQQTQESLNDIGNLKYSGLSSSTQNLIVRYLREIQDTQTLATADVKREPEEFYEYKPYTWFIDQYRPQRFQKTHSSLKKSQ